MSPLLVGLVAGRAWDGPFRGLLTTIGALSLANAGALILACDRRRGSFDGCSGWRPLLVVFAFVNLSSPKQAGYMMQLQIDSFKVYK